MLMILLKIIVKIKNFLYVKYEIKKKEYNNFWDFFKLMIVSLILYVDVLVILF